MERQVFISYAAGDADWTAQRVNQLAEALKRLEVHVHLDVWHRRARRQNLADAEWRKWMDESMASATHVVCLCSSRYREAWNRIESVSGGCGVAFESARIEAYLYQAKQDNKGHVLALVSEHSGREVIPAALKDACPKYTYGNPEDDQFLFLHLCGVDGSDENVDTCSKTAGARDSSFFSSRRPVASEADGRSAESAQQTHEQIAPLDKPATEDRAARLLDAQPADPKSETSGTSPLSRPILLLTVNQRETDAIRAVFGAGQVPDIIARNDYPYERFSAVIDDADRTEQEVIAFSCQMGSERSGAALQRVTKAIEHFKPAAVLAVGVGFGLKDNQSLGDVLISSKVTTYEPARLNKDGSTDRRAETLAATPAWLERAKLIGLQGIKRREGLVLCGEKLVDNAGFRETLRTDYPRAIGGDMESFGVATACNGHDRLRIGWLVIKGISDLGDGAKNAGGEWQADQDQYLAAYRAAMVAFSAVYLRRPDVPTPDEAVQAWLQRQAGRAVGGGDGIDLLFGRPANDAASRQEKMIPLDRSMLQHQATHAIESLRRASAYWTALQASKNLNGWLTIESPIPPLEFVKLLSSPGFRGSLPSVMREFRAVFKEQKFSFENEAKDAAAATVACFLLCTCLLIEAEAGHSVIRLPNVDDRDASHLLASLIALVMVGGRIELRHGGGVLPLGSGTYRVQSTGLNAQFDFERQLFSTFVTNQWSPHDAQKIGELSANERTELLVVLRDLRGEGVRTKSMCFIIEGGEPSTDGIDVAREIGVPVFHASAEVAEVIFGLSEATIVSHLKLLWVDVCAYQPPDAADAASL